MNNDCTLQKRFDRSDFVKMAHAEFGSRERFSIRIQRCLDTRLRHSCGLQILAAPLSPEEGALVGVEMIQRAIDLARNHRHAVLIDLPSTLDEATLAAIDTADVVCVVTAPHLAALRATTDLLATLKELETRRVSLVALNGMTFDLTTPHGRMMATLLAGIAEFERELIQERIRSGIAAAKARGKKLGRQPGQRPKSDRLAPRVLALVAQGRSYRLIGREVGLSKNTVAGIVKRTRAALVGS